MAESRSALSEVDRVSLVSTWTTHGNVPIWPSAIILDHRVATPACLTGSPLSIDNDNRCDRDERGDRLRSRHDRSVCVSRYRLSAALLRTKSYCSFLQSNTHRWQDDNGCAPKHSVSPPLFSHIDLAVSRVVSHFRNASLVALRCSLLRNRMRTIERIADDCRSVNRSIVGPGGHPRDRSPRRNDDRTAPIDAKIHAKVRPGCGSSSLALRRIRWRRRCVIAFALFAKKKKRTPSWKSRRF